MWDDDLLVIGSGPGGQRRPPGPPQRSTVANTMMLER
jgi:hypothetical protein